MISGVSTASNAVSAALASFDRAASAVTSAADSDAVGPQTAGDLAGAIVEMNASASALAAVLVAARTSNDMLAAAINSGNYGPPLSR
jgi:hypothetical protein